MTSISLLAVNPVPRQRYSHGSLVFATQRKLVVLSVLGTDRDSVEFKKSAKCLERIRIIKIITKLLYLLDNISSVID